LGAARRAPVPAEADEESEMTKAANICVLTVIMMLGLAAPAAAAATQGEFDDNCVMGLALGKEIKTDCSVNTVYGGKTYCFGNETARELFLKKPDEFLLKAQIFYSSKPPQAQP
jgi:YHS domain-containing protein